MRDPAGPSGIWVTAEVEVELHVNVLLCCCPVARTAARLTHK